VNIQEEFPGARVSYTDDDGTVVYIWYGKYLDPRKQCPICGTIVGQESDCPGYALRGADGKEHIMVCNPPCGNANYYRCTSDECSWWYREPNNPKRIDTDMGIRAPFVEEPY
jgi:hypothetical protein